MGREQSDHSPWSSADFKVTSWIQVLGRGGRVGWGVAAHEVSSEH